MTHTICYLALAAAVVASGCAYYFDGTVAELEASPGLSVTLAASNYGDCFRSNPDVPVVYGVERPNYSLTIAHGMRYWPEFFLIAHDSRGVVLNIKGAGIRPVEYPRGGNMRRLQEARGTDLSHHVMLDLPGGWDARIGQNLTVQAVREGRLAAQTFVFEILDPDGQILGEEQFAYRVNIIGCREIDGP